MFGLWFGGYLIIIDVPLSIILMVGLVLRTRWGYLMGAGLFSMMALLLFSSLLLALFSQDFLESDPDMTPIELLYMRTVFSIGTAAYGWGTALCLGSLTRSLGSFMGRDHPGPRLICLLVGGRFMDIRKIDIQGVSFEVVMFFPTWKRTPFNEPFSGMVFAPSFFFDPGGMTEFNEIVLLHEMGHVRQSLLFNLPRDLF